MELKTCWADAVDTDVSFLSSLLPPSSQWSCLISLKGLSLQVSSQLFGKGSRRNLKSQFGAFINTQWTLVSKQNPSLKYLSAFHFLAIMDKTFCGVRVWGACWAACCSALQWSADSSQIVTARLITLNSSHIKPHCRSHHNHHQHLH